MATTSGTDARSVAALRRAVLRWGEAHRRDLPWRSTRDPWLVLVSEVMLQQTQAPRVVDPFLRFVAQFPTPAACAAAGAPAAVRAWAGLGYNRRALRLHAAAVAVVERHDGEVPEDLDALLRLPGVGAYTARAVRVFAHEADDAVVDTNVARLLARAVAGAPLRPAESQDLADRLVPPGRAWAFNQALFDLGTAHCRSRHPACAGCPLARRCAWSV
ncbi:MAG: A/G-specific adenine glycosylase, partial [Acidimicrobiales bacterium]